MWSLTEPQGLKVFQVKIVYANCLREDLMIHALSCWCQMTGKTQTTIRIYIIISSRIFIYIHTIISMFIQCYLLYCIFTTVPILWLDTDILVCSSVHGQSSRRMYFLFIYCIFISTQSVGISINFLRRSVVNHWWSIHIFTTQRFRSCRWGF